MEEEGEETDLQENNNLEEEQAPLDHPNGANPNVAKRKCSEQTSDCIKYQMQPRTKLTRMKTRPGEDSIH